MDLLHRLNTDIWRVKTVPDPPSVSNSSCSMLEKQYTLYAESNGFHPVGRVVEHSLLPAASYISCAKAARVQQTAWMCRIRQCKQVHGPWCRAPAMLLPVDVSQWPSKSWRWLFYVGHADLQCAYACWCVAGMCQCVSNCLSGYLPRVLRVCE